VRLHPKRWIEPTCFNTGHVRVRCTCGVLVYECHCTAELDVKRAWFEMHPTSTTYVTKCRMCRPPPKPRDRRRRERRTHTTMAGRLFDARQTTRRKR